VERFAIRVLECDSQPTEVRVLVSLQPQETLAACASKLKGQTSKWLRHALGQQQPSDLLAKGYFACTSGKSTRTQVEHYLEGQGDHHGYSRRVLPPVYVEAYELTPQCEAQLQPQHACAVLQFHLVMVSWARHGIFGPEEARAVAGAWRALEEREQFALRKVSFVPDHVHVAVRCHPSVAPASLVVALMNTAQKTLWEEFADAVIGAKLKRLWQSSAYVGRYGDLATPKLQRYIQNWQTRGDKEG
jgi:REP element-mobilizing transposase RayT